MGDCGAFSYVAEQTPPFTVDGGHRLLRRAAGFDYGVSVDHVILGYDSELDAGLSGAAAVPDRTGRERQEITLDLAARSS